MAQRILVFVALMMLAAAASTTITYHLVADGSAPAVGAASSPAAGGEGSRLMVMNHVAIDPAEIIYANRYKKNQGERLFVVLRGGGELTLHNEVSRAVAERLGVTGFFNE